MIKTPNPNIPAVAADGTTPMTPKEFVEHLRALRGHVPDFGPLPKLSANVLHTASRISAHADFVLASINTVGTSPHIAAAISSDNFALLAEREEADRWSAVEDELRTLLEGVAASNLARRHRIGLTALQVYSIARQLIRKREHADLLPHVENMRRTNPFRSRPKEAEKKPQPAPGTAPATAPAAPPVKA